jgi:hypothetical protein
MPTDDRALAAQADLGTAGGYDLLLELCGAQLLADPSAVRDIRFPPRLPWYRRFLFGPAPPRWSFPRPNS